MKISVVIPMYNEEKIIGDTAKAVSQYMSETFGEGNFEVLFSNDGSLDNSADAVASLELPGVRVVGYEKNRGKGCAVRTAMLEAQGELVVFTDADLAYGTGVIKQVAEAFEANPNAEMVIGSRNLDKSGYEGYTFLRKLMSKVYIKVLCIAGGFKLSDSQCGCKAFTKDAVQRIFPRCEVNRFAFDFEAILWAIKMNMKIVEMPVKVINHGESKVNVIKDTLRMLKDLRRMKKRIKKAKID